MKRDLIYNEVLAMLNERIDYKSITLAEVAERCGMGKSTIYEYFQSKDQMIFGSIVFYLNKMVKFFTSFEVSTFRASLKTFVKAVIVTMKANYWMVMPWTFLDNYSAYLTEQNANDISDMLYKCKDFIYALFTKICEKGADEGTLYEIDELHPKFAFDGIIAGLCDEVDANTNTSDPEVVALIDDLCSCVVKQLN